MATQLGDQKSENREAKSSNCVDTEMSDVKRQYGERCKVLKNQGDFLFVVTVHIDHPAATLKFQIPEKYPADVPAIFVFCHKLTAKESHNIGRHLEGVAKGSRGTPMLARIVAAAESWLTQTDLTKTHEHGHVGDSTRTEKHVHHKKHEKKKKPAKSDPADEVVEKKASMKTAEDVISRFLWDRQLVQQNFFIGYMDRFIGVVEKPFLSFCWDDLSSLDHTVLAIPKHRIQYFKYRDLKIWDKNERLDLVFGSTGAHSHLYDVIAQYDAEHPFDAEDGAAEAKPYSESDSDEDGVTFSYGTAAADTKYDHSDRPNHFIGVHINHPSIVEKIGEIQGHIRGKDSRLVDGFMPLPALHVTFHMLRLDTPEEFQECIRTMHDARFKLRHHLQDAPMELEFDGIGNFNQRVLYGRPVRDERFLKFVQDLGDLLLSNQVRVHHSFAYIPHLTILKMTRPMQRVLSSYYVEQQTYIDRENDYIGKQVIDKMYLCEISEMRDADGFYKCLTEVSLSPETEPAERSLTPEDEFAGEL